MALNDSLMSSDLGQTIAPSKTGLIESTTALYNISAGEEFSGVAYKVVVPAIWGSIIVIGAIGNSIVVFTMCKQGGRTMPRTATNCYIINVALADLAYLFLTVAFTTATYMSPSYQFGDTMCKINNYMIYVTLLSTCLTLTAMTIDRYFAIVYPIRSIQTRTPKVAFIICLTIWIASMLVSSPYLKFCGLGEDKTKYGPVTVCWVKWPAGWNKAVTIIIAMVTYVIPLTIIIGSYTLILRNMWKHGVAVAQRGCQHNGGSSSESATGGGDAIARRRRKVAKMVAVVVILFAITWLPIHSLSVFMVLNENFPKTKAMYDFKIFAHTLSYTSSCVNPFVYTIMGDGFRRAFRESIGICGWGGGSSNSASSRKCQRLGMSSTTHQKRVQTQTQCLIMETGFHGD